MILHDVFSKVIQVISSADEPSVYLFCDRSTDKIKLILIQISADVLAVFRMLIVLGLIVHAKFGKIVYFSDRI